MTCRAFTRKTIQVSMDQLYQSINLLSGDLLEGKTLDLTKNPIFNSAHAVLNYIGMT